MCSGREVKECNKKTCEGLQLEAFGLCFFTFGDLLIGILGVGSRVTCFSKVKTTYNNKPIPQDGDPVSRFRGAFLATPSDPARTGVAWWKMSDWFWKDDNMPIETR